MNDEYGSLWKEAVVAKFEIPGTFLEGLKYTTEDLTQDTRPRPMLKPGSSRIKRRKYIHSSETFIPAVSR
jgi:hypothetical protein